MRGRRARDGDRGGGGDRGGAAEGAGRIDHEAVRREVAGGTHARRPKRSKSKTVQYTDRKHHNSSYMGVRD
jgi:hypothetical protein